MFLSILTSVLITISDMAERQFVTPQEVRHSIAQVVDTIRLQPQDCQVVEETLRQHPMLRTAECYLSTRGDLVVKLTQRVPRLRVRTEAEHYLIDSDRLRMPVRANMKLDVLTFSGTIGERAAAEELFDLAAVIAANGDLAPLIKSVHYAATRIVTLHLQSGQKVLFQIADKDYPKRLEDFVKLYKTESAANAKEFDLRFRGQIVVR